MTKLRSHMIHEWVNDAQWFVQFWQTKTPGRLGVAVFKGVSLGVAKLYFHTTKFYPAPSQKLDSAESAFQVLEYLADKHDFEFARDFCDLSVPTEPGYPKVQFLL